MKKRGVAYKVWISQLFNYKYVKQEEESSYVDFEGKKISRINVIANVVGKFVSDDGNYNAITVDDGSYEIRLKTWGEDCRLFKDVNAGSLVLVIGRVREYNNEIYIIPEIVKVLNDMNWELARKLELLKEHGFVTRINGMFENVIIDDKKEYFEERIEKDIPNDVRNLILGIINKLGGNDVNINEIVKQSGINEEEVNIAIHDLVKDGEIYWSRAGIVNII
ncbi:hypothetical protein J4409_01355 [Candidatus Woesearchaeota archaeon]|nr:hypothetical protein [Candidatus Woesearchaeota archaeon]